MQSAELKKKYNVSGITAIKALQCLTNEGYLVRYQGKGTYVSKARRGKIVKFSDIEKYRNAAERTEVIDIHVMKDPRIAAQLNLGENEEIYHINACGWLRISRLLYRTAMLSRSLSRKRMQGIRRSSHLFTVR